MIHLPRPVPDNNPAEIQAFDTACERLSGFDDRLSAEFVDGWLTALAALPLPHPREVWLPALAGDTFERVFADPADAAQAHQALETRLKVLRAQLDPEALMDRPDELRLSPLMAEWTEADREEARRSAGMSEADAALLVTGGMWADGFTAALEALPEVRLQVDDEDDAADQQRLLQHVVVLALPEGRPELAEHIAKHYTEATDGEALPRDALLDSACFAIQDLRLWWLDHLPRPETRRVQPAPGRNDPCPCGSGQKYKKCHGALA